MAPAKTPATSPIRAAAHELVLDDDGLRGLGLMSDERRRSPRVELLGLVSGRLLPPGTEVVVRDMSLGGLATETPFPFERGSVQELQLTLGDGAAVDLRARVMHCRNIAADGETPRYFTGFQFVDDGDGTPAIGDVLDEAI